MSTLSPSPHPLYKGGGFELWWTLIKIKIGMSCEYKEYEVKMKMVQEQGLELKTKFLLGYTPIP